jgi:hypothetical protein
MTIRQQGGIFGRNPTFNNVTVDGTLTVDQIVEKTPAGGITLDGVTLKDGNVVLADGKGIDFSATAGTGTSELFDDYEEGTWTPTFTYVSAGTLSVSYSSQTGFYTKIGDTVYIRMDLRFSSFTKGTASGTPLIAGLPFVAKNDSGFGRAVINSILYNWTFTSQPVAQVNSSGGSFIGLSRMVSNSTTADLDDPAGNSIIWISGCYHV